MTREEFIKLARSRDYDQIYTAWSKAEYPFSFLSLCGGCPSQVQKSSLYRKGLPQQLIHSILNDSFIVDLSQIREVEAVQVRVGRIPGEVWDAFDRSQKLSTELVLDKMEVLHEVR